MKFDSRSLKWKREPKQNTNTEDKVEIGSKNELKILKK